MICFPECFVPGYRWPGQEAPPPDPAFLQRAWAAVADAARLAGIAVILGTERITDRGLQITACVINPDGAIAGWQDKGQIDPSEEGIYPAFGTERRLFSVGPLTFGVVICHEGWRYPETVRWAVRRGAQLVFHPHAHVAEQGSFRPVTFADPANTFHEKAMLCRAAENTCYFASVNCASEGSGTTSAVYARTVRCSAINRTARKASSWRIWTSAQPPDCSLHGAASHRFSALWQVGALRSRVTPQWFSIHRRFGGDTVGDQA